jgi:hypothetical protein
VVHKLRSAIRCNARPIENSFSRRETSPLCEVLSSIHAPYVPPLSIFVKDLIRRSNVSTGTVIVSLVYIERLQKKLPEATQGEIDLTPQAPNCDDCFSQLAPRYIIMANVMNIDRNSLRMPSRLSSSINLVCKKLK